MILFFCYLLYFGLFRIFNILLIDYNGDLKYTQINHAVLS